MKSIDVRWFGCAALATGFAFALPTQLMAQTSSAGPATTTAHPHSAGSAGFDKPVPTTKLAGYRGGTDVVSNDMRLSGTTAGNTAVNIATGTNAISAGSFSNMSGLPIVIQNTGANVLIQNAVILNLQMN
jgi:hypothetical protein